MRRPLLAFALMLAPTLAHADEDAVRPKSPAMIATGIGTMTVGSVAVGVGIGFVTLYANQITTVGLQCFKCGGATMPRNDAYLVGGTIAIVSGALAILGGIPLVYFGAKHERTGVWLTAGGLSGTF